MKKNVFDIYRRRNEIFTRTQVVGASWVAGPRAALEALEKPIDGEMVLVRYRPGNGITVWEASVPDATFTQVMDFR